MPHPELSFKPLYPCLLVSSRLKSVKATLSVAELPIVQRDITDLLFILALVFFSNLLLPPSLLKAATDSLEIEQIHEFEFAMIPTEYFKLQDLLKKPDQISFEKAKMGVSLLAKKNHTFIARTEIPNNRVDEVVLEALFANPENSDNLGNKVYILDKGLFQEILPIKSRYAAYKISKEHYGKMLYRIEKIGSFSVFGPPILILDEVEAYHWNAKMDRTYIGLVLGIVGIMAIYNLGMLLLFRKNYLLYYFFYCVGIILQFSYTSGLLGYGNASVFAYYFSGIIVSIFIVLFSMSVLNIRYESRRLYYLGFILISIICTNNMAAILGYEASAKFGLLIGPIVLIFSFYLAARSAYHGYRPAFPMMLGWSALLLSFSLVAMQFMISGFPSMGWAPPIAFSFEIATFSFAMGQKLRLSELQFMKENEHAFNQMKKMVYPHQLSRIRSGEDLELTMPTASAQACVLSFDIVGSSKIQHVNAKKFFRNTFTRCNEVISEGYDGKSLKANAYRIKEMGDGFLCSVGYPFEAMSDNLAHDAVDLAKKFAQILKEEAKMLHSETPISCGIGIALDSITGFYPEAGTKEYDLYGQAIVLATRYEGMRKILCPEEGRSVLIIQEKVYRSLHPSHRKGFIELNLKQQGIVVRDDPAATHIYYEYIDDPQEKAEAPPSHLQVV